MRITDVISYVICIPFRTPFRHSRKLRDRTEAIILRLSSDDGFIGWGEVLPREYLTGESISTVLSRHLPDIVNRWRGRALDSCDDLLAALDAEQNQNNPALATRAGWEVAVLDLAGKAFGFAAGDVLGPSIRRELQPGVVIGLDVATDELEKHCILIRLRGRHHVKLKVGQGDDLRRLQIVSGVLGEIPIRIDANGAWSEEQAISQLRQMKRYNLCSVEEPLCARDFSGMRRVREKTGLKVVADESLCSLADGEDILATQAADIFNIRVAKCGGFMSSMALVALAKDAGRSCQLGTLVGETGILSRASDIFGDRIPGFEFLEGKGQNRRLLEQDIVEPLQAAGSHINGLGIEVSPEIVERWSTCATQIVGGTQGVTI